jgi:acyl-CoA synthetase (AMP-forming)/AMP-acid ligase II
MSRTSIAFIAPPIAVALAKHPMVDDYDLSSLNGIMSGAAPLDADLGHAVAERLGCPVVQSYGLSELSPASHTAELGGVDCVECGFQTRPSRHRRGNRHPH